MVVDTLRLQTAGVAANWTWTAYYVDPGEDDSVVAVLDAVFAPLQSGRRVQWTREVTLDGPDGGAGVDGPYPSYRDFVTLQFQASDLKTVKLAIPTPNSTMLDATNEIVDESESDVADLIAVCIAYLVASNGATLDEYVQGWRWMASV